MSWVTTGEIFDFQSGEIKGDPAVDFRKGRSLVTQNFELFSPQFLFF